MKKRRGRTVAAVVLNKGDCALNVDWDVLLGAPLAQCDYLGVGGSEIVLV